jgi:uncharacterized protein YggE
MRQQLAWNVVCGICLVGFMPAIAAAQAAAEDALGNGAITVTGAVTLRRPATILRLQAQLVAKGHDLKEALEQLPARREAFLKQFQLLEADKDSLELGRTQLYSQDNQQMLQMQRMQQRIQQGLPPEPPAPVARVSLPLKAEWTLTGETPEELLLAADALQAKIKAADLGWPPNRENRQPLVAGQVRAPFSESNLDDELQGQAGVPIFQYVALISTEDQERALAEAFQNARASAARLAKAAGEQVGGVRNLKDISQSAPGRRARPSTREVVSFSPGEVNYRVALQVSFDLKPAAPTPAEAK